MPSKFIRVIALALLLALEPTCTIRDTVLHPTFPDGGLLAHATQLPAGGLAHLDGMYKMAVNSAAFGAGTVAVHTVGDTLSIFAEPNAAYAVMHAGCIENGSKVVLEGTWRFPTATNTGLIQLFVGPSELAASLCTGEFSKATTPSSAMTLTGLTGNGNGSVSNAATLLYDHALKNTAGKFVVVAHHGACATTDDCGASENSLESIRMAESFGASVVELDIHISADGIPFLFHDDDFDARLAAGPFCHGPVDQFTLANIRANCTLKFGETIPTLDEALATVVNDTTLRGVWIDPKVASAIVPALAVMKKYDALAAQRKPHVNFVIGLPETDILATYTGLNPPAPKGTLCLVELAPSDVRNANCGIWAPRWTNGPSASDVIALQAEGRSVVFWTMDEQQYIDLFLTSTTPNGIVTDRPGLVFQRFQMIGTLPPDRTQL